MRLTAFAAGLLMSLAAGPALADGSDFEGVWTDALADGSGISRIAVVPGSGLLLVVHIYGKCVPKECDWGNGFVRYYTDGPAAREITSIAFDFDTGFAHKRLTLRPGIGHTLRFDLQTDFTDRSGRSNYATSGALTYAGSWEEAPRVAAASPPPVAAPAQTATTGTPPPAVVP